MKDCGFANRDARGDRDSGDHFFVATVFDQVLRMVVFILFPSKFRNGRGKRNILLLSMPAYI